MKTCPTCRRNYEDASIVFCLEDGARLREITDRDPDATLHLAQPPAPTIGSPSPRPTVPAQPTITARPDQYHVVTPGAGAADREPIRKSSLPWIFGIVVVLAISGVLIAWLLSRSGDRLARDSSPTPQPSPSIMQTPGPTVEPTRSPSETPGATPNPTETPRTTPQPTREKPKSMFAVFDNTSLNGSRITYYPRPSFGLCEADCAANANCKGFTWIRPGAYNPGDSAMCYLMSEVTAKATHNCCISAVRN